MADIECTIKTPNNIHILNLNTFSSTDFSHFSNWTMNIRFQFAFLIAFCGTIKSGVSRASRKKKFFFQGEIS